MSETKLRMLPRGQYKGVNRHDPLRFYYWPVLGPIYRKRVEVCLSQCSGGERVLEVGFGSGLTFLNLADKYRQIHGLDLTAATDEVAAVFHTLGIDARLRQGSVLDMPYQDAFFDTVLLISILEHLKPAQQARAFREIERVLRPGGQVVYGVPIERPLMTVMFRFLGYDIRQHHFSTHSDVLRAADDSLQKVRLVKMVATPRLLGPVYEVGHFAKPL